MILIGMGRIVAQGNKQSLLAMDTNVSALVNSLDNQRLAEALQQKGYTVAPEGEGLRVGCAPEDVGRVALEAQIVLADLRSGAAGLEDLFLELTSDSQRDVLNEGAPA
jgi:ABC-2 type transport system ATP-binding protein